MQTIEVAYRIDLSSYNYKEITNQISGIKVEHTTKWRKSMNNGRPITPLRIVLDNMNVWL